MLELTLEEVKVIHASLKKQIKEMAQNLDRVESEQEQETLQNEIAFIATVIKRVEVYQIHAIEQTKANKGLQRDPIALPDSIWDSLYFGIIERLRFIKTSIDEQKGELGPAEKEELQKEYNDVKVAILYYLEYEDKKAGFALLKQLMEFDCEIDSFVNEQSICADVISKTVNHEK
ncbi:hypothetical protein IC620_14770 [Hazenella sp. IB182357]|uniref:Uncharacterized protein n=1 Tax=Polycladospora coralii TaxID=2771432 RepID=A0A926NHY0_9BACL|nr:hypothetical protein [Polycladospora coralii]MBD1373608.1 hypothetical protein [Polycladospora coralii]MBS7529651.1 hypothetical protein [Polycladospora coralii]